jgi:hypothetical protein
VFKLLFGILLGAGGYWAYRFWKGEDDTSWDQSWSSTGSSSTYGGPSSDSMSTTGSTGSGSTVSSSESSS